MPASERRERERQELRRRILDAARELFAKQGYAAVTMRAIAAAIDYTPTTIYLYFADKDSLLREICEADFAALRAGLGRIAAERDPVVRLRAMGTAYVEFALAHPNHYRLMFMVEVPADVVAEQFRRSSIPAGDPNHDPYAFLVRAVEDAIAAGRLRPEFADAHLTAQVLWAGLHGIVSLHLVCGADPWTPWRDARATAQAAIEAMLHGMMRPAPATRRGAAGKGVRR